MQIRFVITAGGVHYYLTRLKLAPHETRAIDLGQLENYQRPDFKGKKIPFGAEDGSVNWIRLDNVPVSGRVAVIQKQTGTASSYDCFDCSCGIVFTGGVALSPGGLNLLPGGHGQEAASCAYRDCNGLSYWYDETDYCSWSSGNQSVASVNSWGTITANTGGSTVISASWSDCGNYPPWYQGGGCSCTSWMSGSGNAPAYVVEVTGPDTLWWFNGQTPSGYATTITLTAVPSGASYYGWSIVAGTDKAALDGESGNTADFIGNSPSTSSGDVTVQVEVETPAGTTQAAKDITVLGPFELVPGVVVYSPDPGFGYSTQIWYTIDDNFGANMPSTVGFAEQWTTSMDNSPYPTNNWGNPVATGSSTSNSQFYDLITGPGLANNPPPVPTPTFQSPLSGTLIQQRGQEWRVGSSVPGYGARVQTDTFQRFIDHGHHANIASPAP